MHQTRNNVQMVPPNNWGWTTRSHQYVWLMFSHSSAKPTKCCLAYFLLYNREFLVLTGRVALFVWAHELGEFVKRNALFLIPFENFWLDSRIHKTSLTACLHHTSSSLRCELTPRCWSVFLFPVSIRTDRLILSWMQVEWFPKVDDGFRHRWEKRRLCLTPVK